MEDNDDNDIKLKEEMEAELDKISLSSLENDDLESDSESETQSGSSDTVSAALLSLLTGVSSRGEILPFSVCVLCTYLIIYLRITFKWCVLVDI